MASSGGTSSPKVQSPIMPPPPADFDFAFDPNLFPAPPPLPSSADLFTASETTDLLGFLNTFDWDVDFIPEPSHDESQTHTGSLPSYPNPHLNVSPPNPNLSMGGTSTESLEKQQGGPANAIIPPAMYMDPMQTPTASMKEAPPDSKHEQATTTTPLSPPRRDSILVANYPRNKPLLTTPQKRLNHIMSEQKRRNAIRDGYAQLIALLAPAGSPPGLGMPTRGRPKGSGSRGKGKSQGKSGVLFRAVEYTRFLEESRDALRAEVLRVESAAGIKSS